MNSFSQSLILPILLGLSSGLAYADATGPDPGLAGVPGEAGTCTNCHGSGPTSINKNGGTLSLSTGTSSSYTPGELQHWILTIADPTAKRWGFQAAARQSNATNALAGGFLSTDSNTQVICSNSNFRTVQRTTSGACSSTNPLMYVEQTLSGTRLGTTASTTFQFDWKAPATNIGPVTVYVAANAANGNNQDDTGDHIYTATFTLNPAESSSQTPAITSIVNGASFTPGIEAGSWVTIQGTNLTPATSCDPVNNPGPGCRTWSTADFANGTPTSLDGVSVLIGGLPAYVYYISPTQINVLAPQVPSGSAPVVVTNSLGMSNTATATVATFAPGFFQNGNNVIATHQDGTLVAPAGTASGAKPAAKGETIILWGTGFGAVTPSVPAGQTTTQAFGSGSLAYATTPPSITIGGTQATVVADALSPAALGLYQIAVTIPSSAPSGNQPIVAALNGASSPSSVLLAIQ